MSPKSKRRKKPRKSAPPGHSQGSRPIQPKSDTPDAPETVGWRPAEVPAAPAKPSAKPDAPHPWKGANAPRTLRTRLFPQWVKTVLAVLFWIVSMPIYVSTIAPYSAYVSAYAMGNSLAIFSGLAPHLWQSRTPPWRTVFWAWFASTFVAIPLLVAETGRLAVVAATLVGFAIVIARAGQNGRRLVNMIRDWRAMR